MYDNSYENTCRYLNNLHITYRILKDSTNDGISGAKTCEALGFSPSEVYKTIMVLSNKKNHPYIAVLPADRKLDLDNFSRAAGTPCHKAGNDFARSVCLEDKGMFGPFFPKNITVCLDNSAKEHKNIVVNAGGAGNYIELTVSDFVFATDCRYGDLSSGISVELYGRNYDLPIGTVIDRFQINSVKKITPLEIFYGATDNISGQTVNICEFFPRFHGCYASRGINGEVVKWLKYTNDMQPRYTPDLYGMIKSRYRVHNMRDVTVNCPKVILQTEKNDTFYTVYEQPYGKSLIEILSETDSLSWEEIKNTLLPLLSQIQSEKRTLGCIRPDTVYLDRQNRRACLLPFCTATDTFGQSNGLRFLYHADYEPFMGTDETAFFRILCFALVGKSWYSYGKSELSEVIKNMLPDEEAKRILNGARL